MANPRPQLAAAGLLAVAVAVAAALSPGVAADQDPAAWVEQRVAAWQPTAAERRFDEIGWVRNVQEAERLAARHGRPVFLFTHDGRMAIGRC